MQTVHHKFGESTALLAGDVMLVTAYEYLNKVSPLYFRRIIGSFLIKLPKKFAKGSNWTWTSKKWMALISPLMKT
jgi:geranylgeranyl pyrophosphate synthase